MFSLSTTNNERERERERYREREGEGEREPCGRRAVSLGYWFSKKKILEVFSITEVTS